MKGKISIFEEDDYTTKSTVCFLVLLAILGAIFGFVYETLFYRIDLGYFTKRGSTFGPWIPIYAVGSILLMLLCYRHRKKPLKVFLLSCIVTGALEYCTGWFFYEVFNLRLWDYNKEIWNFGNINGYICLRSVLFFGVSSLLKKLYDKTSHKVIDAISITLGVVFILDIILHFIFA